MSNSNPFGRPEGAIGERTRAQILDAALEAFADTGFEAMSVRELTRRLHVSHNLVHHHFGSKRERWRAALEHGVGATAKELMALLGGQLGSPAAKRVLREGMERAIALLTRHPAIVRILADEFARPGPRLDCLYERYLGPMVDALSRFLAESRQHGVRDVDSRVAALFVLSSASTLFTHAALAEKLGLGMASGPGHTESLVDLALGGLMSEPAQAGDAPRDTA